jgi:Na+-driven multidrug efflux pump
LGSTANTLISNLVGQKDLPGVKQAILKISFVSLGFAVFSSLLIWFFPQFCIGIFMNKADSLELMPLALEALPILIGVFILMSFSNIVYNGVISVGDIFIALWIEVVVVILYIAFFSYVLSQPWANLWWVWTAEWVYWLTMLAGSLLFFRFRNIKFV